MAFSVAITHPGPRLSTFGSGYIAGQAPGLVTVAGAPARQRVFLYDKATHERLSVTSSALDGTYRFDYLDPARRYYLTAFDSELQFNAVIRDNITPAVDE